MWEEIFNLAINNGLWAVLFLGLFIYQLRDSKNRENKYQQTIETLGKALETVDQIRDDVLEIKEKFDSVVLKKKKEIKDDK